MQNSCQDFDLVISDSVLCAVDRVGLVQGLRQRHISILQERRRKNGDWGYLAETLFSKPVRPLWGREFGGGAFDEHIWSMLYEIPQVRANPTSHGQE